MRPTLPYMGVNLDLDGSQLGPESFWTYGGARADASLAVATVAGARGNEAERWAQQYLQATEMLPRVVVKQALMQACRLWTRVFPTSSLPSNVTPTNSRRLQECSQLVLSSLLLLGWSFF